MELKKLKNSIALNSNEKPSIYSAICMIETLFKDIKDESGVSIQNNPPGELNSTATQVSSTKRLNSSKKRKKSSKIFPKLLKSLLIQKSA